MIGYVDMSAITVLAFDEHHAARVARSVSGMSHLVSSNLLEAELRSACRRQNAGPLRGAGIWHWGSGCCRVGTPELDRASSVIDWMGAAGSDECKVAAAPFLEAESSTQ